MKRFLICFLLSATVVMGFMQYDRSHGSTMFVETNDYDLYIEGIRRIGFRDDYEYSIRVHTHKGNFFVRVNHDEFRILSLNQYRTTVKVTVGIQGKITGHIYEDVPKLLRMEVEML